MKRGAELAILLGSQVDVLLVAPSRAVDPVVAAGAAGHACIVNNADIDYASILARSIALLKERGVNAEGHLTQGDTIERISEFAQRLQIDLIVLGHYPQAKGGFWWSGPQRKNLTERVRCCVMIAME